MKKKTIAMVIEAKKDKDLALDFCAFTGSMRKVVSELSLVYDEVFAWAADNYMAIWVTGKHASFLIQSLSSFRHDYVKVELKEGMQAQQLFRKITEGKMWEDVCASKKLDTLQFSYELTNEINSLGPALFPFVTGSISSLTANSVVYGSRHSWMYSAQREAQKKTPIVNIKSKDIFYRFCIN